jgi:hypothetical protein
MGMFVFVFYIYQVSKRGILPLTIVENSDKVTWMLKKIFELLYK